MPIVAAKAKKAVESCPVHASCKENLSERVFVLFLFRVAKSMYIILATVLFFLKILLTQANHIFVFQIVLLSNESQW